LIPITAWAAMYLKAALGADGKPTAWLQRSTFPPIASTFDATALTADAGEIGLGWSDLPYAIPNHRAEGKWRGENPCANRLAAQRLQHISRLR